MSNSIVIDQGFCKGCQLCISVCQKDVWELSSVRNAKGYLVPVPSRAEDCVGCLMCEMTCPDMCITVTVIKEGAQKDAA
jgi:2-oxoglutarate ferredoxin oxidoreductase subunit delta